MVTARARKKLPVTWVTETRGRNTMTGVMVEKTSGRLISWIALRTAADPRLSRFAMHRNVLHHHDRVVDDQPDRRRQTAQGHQVKALAGDAEKENGHRDGDRDDQAGDQRRSPVVEKEEQDDTGEHQADENSVADAENALAHQLRLVVKSLM